MPAIAAGNRIKSDGLYFFSLSSGEGRGLGEVFLDFLGNRGISTTLNWSLSRFGLALATHSFYLQVIHNNLNLRRLYMDCTRRHLGGDMKHFKLGMDINSTHGKQRVQKRVEPMWGRMEGSNNVTLVLPTHRFLNLWNIRADVVWQPVCWGPHIFKQAPPDWLATCKSMGQWVNMLSWLENNTHIVH